MAPNVSLLYILFTIGFLTKRSTGLSELELGVHFLDEPRDVIGLRGKSLNIPCRAKTTGRHRESFEVLWYHDNKKMDLRNDKRRTVFQNGTLHFSKLVHKATGHSDQGEYRCVAATENGALSSKPGFLRISTAPENFSRHPVSQIVEIGSNVRLVCEIEYFGDTEIVWEKDEKIIQNAGKYATISGPDKAGSTLYIFNVGHEESGKYRCTARNILLNKERHSSNGLLTVIPQKQDSDLKPLTFLSAQQSFPLFSTNTRKVKEGENVTLYCVADNYSALILGWTYAKHGQNATRSLYNFTKPGHDLINFKNVSRQQEGWYICNAMGPSNRTIKKLKTNLMVLVPPQIKEKSENIVFRTSKTVRFRCAVHGNPIPDIYWLKDGNLFNVTGRIKHRSVINESEQMRTTELIVASTVTSDAGIYQCVAKNSVGLAWAASRLLLNATKPAPGAPERVTCESVSSSQIKLTWDISNSSSEIKAFTIHYHLTDNGEEMQKVISSDSRSIQIDKLSPFSNYTFYLRLYMDSASEFSEPAICQTGEEAPIDAPRKKLHFISQNSVHISWTPLDKGKARGIINKYKIQWRSTKSPSLSVFEVTGNVFNYTITGLVPGKKYDVRVLAATSKGFPASDLPWETFEIPLNFNSNIPAPPKVILQAVNSSDIEITWRLTNHNDATKIIGYKIFYRRQNDNKKGPIVVDADTNKYVLRDLEPETWYEIAVLGFTEKGDGERGVAFMTTTSNFGNPIRMEPEFLSIPEPPVSLEADPVSPVAINLTWSTPQSPSGFNTIKHYTVCFNPVQSSHIKNTSINCINSLENKISIGGLNPYTLYEFKVRSHDLNDKQSLFSPTMECHTLEGVPSQVLDINWKTINKTAVQVSWKEPRHINGILKGYTLSYTDNYNLPLESWSAKMVSPSIYETQLTDLNSNVKYYFIVRASTGAGLGASMSPKQIFITSKATASNKQTDHYIGIIVGLGIGIFCIIICTICILCRRRCLKRQISQEFEVPSCRYSNESGCQRDRECPTESRETEYFTFLSEQREQPNSLEIGVRHLDTKGSYLNGSGNGIRMSLLSESKIAKDGLRKINIYVNETPTLDPLVPESVANTKTQLNSNCPSSKLKRDHLNESKTPLLMRRRKWLDVSSPNSSDTNDSEPESCTKTNRTLPSFDRSYDGTSEIVTAKKQTLRGTGNADRRKESNDEGNWSEEVNNILQNPEFRFSNSSNEISSRNHDTTHRNYIYNELNGTGEINRNEVVKYHLNYSGYNDSRPLHFVVKEIIQES